MMMAVVCEFVHAYARVYVCVCIYETREDVRAYVYLPV